ncbi:hypothetical protein [Ochrobactrum quorumnocens]|nr:hypothetical protein [[Ochrobactrum] quorumnocens]
MLNTMTMTMTMTMIVAWRFLQHSFVGPNHRIDRGIAIGVNTDLPAALMRRRIAAVSCSGV